MRAGIKPRFVRLLGLLGVAVCLAAVGMAALLIWKYPSIDFLREKLAGARSEREGNYRQALLHFEAALEGVPPRSPERVEVLTHIGACHLRLRSFASALRVLIEARQLAIESPEPQVLAGLDINIAAVYLDLGDWENAEAVLRRALSLVENRSEFAGRSSLYANLALARVYQGSYGDATRLLDLALRHANEQRDNYELFRLLAIAHMEAGDLAKAVSALERSLALSEPAGDRFHQANILQLLGTAAWKQGQREAAAHLFGKARVLAGQSSNRYVSWAACVGTGNVLMAQKDFAGAAVAYKDATEQLKQVREEVVPTDRLRIRSFTRQYEAFLGLASSLAEQYFQTGRKQLARESLQAVEWGRAQSLRASVREGSRRPHPQVAQRLELIAGLEQKLSIADPKERPSLRRQLRSELLQIERLAARLRLTHHDADRAETRLSQDTRSAPWLRAVNDQSVAVISVALAEPASYAWLLSGAKIKLRRLAGRAEILRNATRFREAIEANEDHANTGAELFSQLFAQFDRESMRKPNWILSVDGELAVVPFAALRPSASGRPLISDHSLSLTPGLWALGDKPVQSASRQTVPYVGFGDPVFSRADPRWKTRLPSSSPFPLLGRLPASLAEVNECSKQFGREAVALSGFGASRGNLEAIRPRSVRVLHFASHVLIHPDEPMSSSIVLSLNPDTGRLETLTARDVHHSGFAADIVLLNGCSSAAGVAVPGEGIVSLPRAFLAAGASAVVATGWPVSDRSGLLFHLLCKNLARPVKGNHRVARALRRTQLRIMESGGWRARPSYWAAPFLIGG